MIRVNYRKIDKQRSVMNAIEIETPAANINVSELGVKFSENVSIEEWKPSANKSAGS